VGVSLGALELYLGNNRSGIQGVFTGPTISLAQLLANHLQVTRDTMVSLLFHTISTSGEAITGAIQDVNNYLAWLNYLATITNIDASSLPSDAKFSFGFDGNLTIPQITLQPADPAQPPIVISEFTLQPDGTATGGTVSS
jgi:hypothetical protein